MDENLTDGGEGGRSGRPGGLIRTTSSSSIPQIKRWIRTPKAIIMHLTNGTIQVQNITYQSHPPSWGTSAALSPISCGRACLPPFPYWSINIDPQSHITDLLHLHDFHNTNNSTSLPPGELLQGPHQADCGRGEAICCDLHQLREAKQELEPS